MRTVCYLLSLSLILLSGCRDKSVSKKLEEIDSLIVAEQNDSAYHLIMSIVGDEISGPEDKAHYNLLVTQTNYLVGHPLEFDSLLDNAIDYYQEKSNQVKLADAYYYKGIGLFMKNDINLSMIYHKKAEEQSKISGNVRQQYKIKEGISFVNSMNGQYGLALRYARQALDLAKNISNKRWLADAYYRIGMAYSDMEQPDSAICYFNMTEPYINDVREIDKPYFLSNLGLAYMDKDRDKSKYYLTQALSYKETTRLYEYLADIAYSEKDLDRSHHLLMKALAVNDLTPKDNIIHNLLEYDIEHGKTDDVCDQVNEIIAIKDSIINKVKNDTIRDLQIRFDHQVEMNAVNKRLIVWQWILGGVGLLVLILVGYIIWKKHKTKFQKLAFELQIRKLGIDLLSLKNSVAEANCQISDLKLENSQKQEEIKTLECSNDNAEKQIKELKTVQNLNQQKIAQLEKVKEEAILEAREIDEKLKTWQGKEAYKVTRGAYLYDKVLENQKINLWTPADYEAFISYYEIGHYKEIRKIRRKYDNLTQRNLLYLILVDMGKDTDEISNIMSIEKQSIRSMRFRIEHNGKRL